MSLQAGLRAVAAWELVGLLLLLSLFLVSSERRRSLLEAVRRWNGFQPLTCFVMYVTAVRVLVVFVTAWPLVVLTWLHCGMTPPPEERLK